MMSEQRIASVVGLREPAAKGAMVRGIRPTATSLCNDISKALHIHCEIREGRAHLSKVQW